MWNLRHEYAEKVYKQWMAVSFALIQANGTDDQHALHIVLKKLSEDERRKTINAINTTEISYSLGTFIKHFIRSNHRLWQSDKSDNQDRMNGMLKEATTVCQRWKHQCEEIDDDTITDTSAVNVSIKVSPIAAKTGPIDGNGNTQTSAAVKSNVDTYEVTTDESIVWRWALESRWFRYSEDETKEKLLPGVERKQRILIAQYTGWDPFYCNLTNVSERPNRAYAFKWKYDYHRIDGNAVIVDANQKEYDVHPTFNKIALLGKAIEDKIYDFLLILDGDAFVVDLDFDAIRLSPGDRLLTALRIKPWDAPFSGHINIGVTMWNLRHEYAEKVYKQWMAVSFALIRANGTDDQEALHIVLKKLSEDEQRKTINAINTTEISYWQGTFIKHFIRSNGRLWQSDKSDNQDRMNVMLQEATKVCQRWKEQCEEIVE